MVMTRNFPPMGLSNELQGLITDLAHRVVRQNGKFTLAELGYLHMNSITFVENHAEVKLYFLPSLATVKKAARNGSTTLVPSDMLKVFKNYFYVGDDLNAVISYDTMTVPKYKVVKDELDRPAIQIKDGKKVEEDVEVLVLHCNLALVMAAAIGISLADPSYEVTFETVGSMGGKKATENQIVMTAGSKREFPIRVSVTYEASEDGLDTPIIGGYDPDDALPYLIAQLEKAQKAAANRKKLSEKVSDEAKSAQKKEQAKAAASYLKNR